MTHDACFFLHDKIHSADDVAIDPHDRGFLLGDGIFETFKLEDGVPVLFEKHWQRLTESAEFLEIPLAYSAQQVHSLISELAVRNGLSHSLGGARLTLTRGIAARGLVPHGEVKPTLLVTTFNFPAIYTSDKHYRLCLASSRRNEFSALSRIKSTNYLDNILMRKEAEKRGFDDAIFLNSKGQLTETTVANLFFIKDNTVYTPPIEAGVLPGVMRSTIIDYCQTKCIKIVIEPLENCFIQSADAAFITNALMGAKPVSAIEDRQLDAKNKWLQLLLNDVTKCRVLQIPDENHPGYA